MFNVSLCNGNVISHWFITAKEQKPNLVIVGQFLSSSIFLVFFKNVFMTKLLHTVCKLVTFSLLTNLYT